MLIILPILLVLYAYYFSKFIRINSILLYIVAILLASASLLYDSDLFLLISTGYLGLSFYIVVMYTGILKTGSKIKKQLSSVRKDYAILGFILIFPHAYSNILESINSEISIPLLPLVTFILMIPLFITSFQLVRKKIPTSEWIKLHKLSYLVYLLIFLHIISIGSGDTVILYYIIFGVYSLFALNKRFTSHTYIKASTITIIVGSLSLIFVTNIFEYYEKPVNVLEDHTFKDGIYIGYAKGYQNLDTIVRVSIKSDQIEYVLIESCGCTPYSADGYYANASFQIATEIKNQNRTDIDSIGGATQSCNAINNAVIDALSAAIIE